MSLALDAILNQLLLEQEYKSEHVKSLREWAMGRLRMDAELNNHVDQYVRLRIALSLCPVSALTHRKSERLSRSEKISNYLIEEKLVSGIDDARRLAIIVDKVVDNWLTERINVAGFRDALISRDGTLCNACHVDLNTPSAEVWSVVHKDEYKLTWIDPERAVSYTVDHRDPVSKFGTNELSNLEILCRYCNEGKDDGSPMLLKHEVELAADLPVRDEETARRLVGKSARLVYRVLRRDYFTCALCGSKDLELTIRKLSNDGLAVMSNLTTVCSACVDDPRE